MKKKHPKKLELHRETLRQITGGTTIPFSVNPSGCCITPTQAVGCGGGGLNTLRCSQPPVTCTCITWHCF